MGERRDQIVVEQSYPDLRLDVFLKEKFPAVSRGAFQRLINDGHILVNSTAAKPTQSPRAGDLIDISWPEPKRAEALPEEISLEILFEDADLLVINKPPGLVVHPAVGHDEHTLVNALLHHCHGQLSGIGGIARPGIVHRLDKDTSGCIVVAKNDTTHLGLSVQFEQRTVAKSYLALLCGLLPEKSGEIKAAIARHPTYRKRMAVTKDGNGREAWTSYRVLERLKAATLVEATLHTGRTHQIRVHFQHLGYPLVGDDLYGERQNKRLVSQTRFKPSRQILHAWKLAFTHPTRKVELQFIAPVPEDFKAAIRTLGGTFEV
ncbi:MAG: RluA family pseudouridine synthase [Verrucomicrobiota bacterium]|nr:RluA family pseudouridine synthase [Verrucomicrobiota bacterium]